MYVRGSAPRKSTMVDQPVYPDVVTVNATDADAEVVVYPRGEIVTNVVVCVFILLFTVLK